jgi:hypothetical protein
LNLFFVKSPGGTRLEQHNKKKKMNNPTPTIQSITLCCARALEYDNKKQYQLAIKEYGNCITMIGQFLSNNNFMNLTAQPKNIKSLMGIVQQCMDRTDNILTRCQSNNASSSSLGNATPTPTTPTLTPSPNIFNMTTSSPTCSSDSSTLVPSPNIFNFGTATTIVPAATNNTFNPSAGALSSSEPSSPMPSYPDISMVGNVAQDMYLTSKSAKKLTIDDIEDMIESITRDNEQYRKQIDEIIKTQRKTDYPLAKELAAKYEEGKMKKFVLEQYLSMKRKTREEKDSRSRKIFLEKDSKSIHEFKHLSLSAKHASTPEANRSFQLILKHYHFAKQNEDLDREQKFLSLLPSAKDKENYIRQHLSSSAKRMKTHPLARVLSLFAEDFNNKYTADAGWYNLDEAIQMVKSFGVQLTEVITAQWIAFNPNCRKFLFYIGEEKARQQLDQKGIINGFALWRSVLSVIMEKIYDKMMFIYNIQAPNKTGDFLLQKLKSLSLADMSVPEPFLMSNEEDPYNQSIATLSKIKEVTSPDDQLAVMLATYISMVDECKSYCEKYSQPFENFSEQECPVMLYIILRTGIANMNCIVRYVRDFLDGLDEESSYVLSLMETTLQWSLEFNSEEWLNYERSKQELNNQ